MPLPRSTSIDFGNGINYPNNMPDDKSWIKLYRKIIDHDVFQDARAFQLFIWLLISVDRNTGKIKTGRFWLSEILKVNPNTLKDVTKRLDKKYKIITTHSTNRYTEISLLNWSKYQSRVVPTPQEITNETPTEHQQNTTNQEVKNKRIKNLSPIIPLNKYSHLEDIHDDDLQDISTNYNVPMYLVKLQHEQLTNYCESSGKKYKNYKSALRNFVLRAASEQMNRQQKGGVLDATNI